MDEPPLPGPMTTATALGHDDDDLPRGHNDAPAGEGKASNLTIISDIEAQVKNLAEQVSRTLLALASNLRVASPFALNNCVANGAVAMDSWAAQAVKESRVKLPSKLCSRVLL